MNGEEFVKAIKISVRESTINGSINMLEKPPGRKPRQKNLTQSEWYHNLSEGDNAMLKSIISEVVDASLFGFFAVLDGVRAFEDREDKGTLKLFYRNTSEEVLLNNPDEEYLHDIYNGLTNDD